MIGVAAAVSSLLMAVVIVPGASAPNTVDGVAKQKFSSWCDMAALVARMQPLPMAQDPVFRRPTPIGREKLQAVRAMVANAKSKRDQRVAKSQLRSLFAGREGPVLARLSLQMRDATFRGVALGEIARIAGKYPRLASFAGQDVQHADPAVAAGAVRVLLASRCDTAANYALDGLLHADPRVRRAVAEEVLSAAPNTSDMGLVGRLLAHMAHSERDQALRATVYRRIGRIGWLPAAADLAVVIKDKATPDSVRCEAVVAEARITGRVKQAQTRKLLGSKSPWLRVCGVRAVASGMTNRPKAGAAMLKPLLADHRTARDLLGGKKTWKVSEAARLAVVHLLLK